MADIDYNSAKEYLTHEHYYGREVRSLFIVSAIVMLLTLPVFNSLIPFNGIFSMAMIIVVGFLAGLLSPLSRSVMVVCTLVAALGGFAFEYEAVSTFWQIDTPLKWWFFAVNQLLALLFFFALYYGSKTLRGIFFNGKTIR